MKLITKFSLLLALTILLIGNLRGQQQSRYSVKSDVDKSTITIGDVVTYTIIVEYANEVQVEKPPLADNLGAFEIRDYKEYDKEQVDDQIVERIDYFISTFDVGEFEIPPLEFHFVIPGDTTKKVLRTNKIKILVESLNPSVAGDIRDIKVPMNLPKNYRKLILWGALGLGILILALLAFYIWRRKKAGKALLPKKEKPRRPAHEVALDELNALKDSSLLAAGKVKEFYIKISEIIRRYIEGRYFIIALEMTTFDLIENLKSAEIEPENVQLIIEFLDICDLVKFAKYKPTEEEHASTINKAFEIVERTKIVYYKPEIEKITPEEQSEEADLENNKELLETLEEQN
ncbi:MAG: BatD family protein [bacterium]